MEMKKLMNAVTNKGGEVDDESDNDNDNENEEEEEGDEEDDEIYQDDGGE